MDDLNDALDEAFAVIGDFEQFCAKFCKIRNKAGKLVPFIPNRAQKIVLAKIQRQIDAGQPIRIRVLKYRQAGLSLLTIIYCWWWTLTHPGQSVISIANRRDLPQKWVGKLRLLQEQLEAQLENPPIKKICNTLELSYKEIDSHYYIGSSEGTTPGMGDTLQGVHLSEKPYWLHADATVGELIPAVPLHKDTFVIQESTGLAIGDEWHRDYYAAKTGFDKDGKPCHYEGIFLPWFLDEDYSVSDTTWESLGDLDATETGIIQSSDEYCLTDDAKRVNFKGVTAGQIAWRRVVLVSEYNGDEAWFANKFPSTEREAFLAGGLNVFQPPEIGIAKTTIRKPEWEGEILTYDDKHPDQYRLNERPSGQLSIWEQPDKRYHYAIGADNMWGKAEDTDFDVLFVQCLDTDKIVARCKGRFELITWGRIMMGLGYHYNTACIAPEINGGPPSQVLMPLLLGKYRREWRYPNIYIRGDMNKLNPKGAVDYGWWTDPKSKSDLVGHAIQSTLGCSMDWACSDAVEQMASFIKTFKGDKAVMSAPEGMHDDDLMARMITELVSHRIKPSVKLWSAKPAGPQWGSQAYFELQEAKEEAQNASKY